MTATIPNPRATLLCIPTELEHERLARIAPAIVAPDAWLAVVTTGFGPIAAAARAAALIAERRPKRLVLIGIAGALGDGLGPGQATWFGDVALDGVGAGEGAALRLPSELGLAGPDHRQLALDDRGPLLLTVCAAAEGAAMLDARRARFPAAQAEDMEAFGVALAARNAGIPLHVARGVSNVAGDRDHSHWQIDEALGAAAALVQAALRTGSTDG